MIQGKHRFWLAAASVIVLAACAAEESPSTATGVAHDSVENGEWLTWGGGPGFQRYSPLAQINADNVGQLEIAWRKPALEMLSGPDRNLKATPLYIDGVLYAPTGVNQALALDPATGETIWQFNPDPADTGIGRGYYISSRALAYWTDGQAKRLFHNTVDGRLISIDATTGLADSAFGDNGYINLRANLRPDGQDVPSVGSSSPAAIVGDTVVVQVVGDVTSANKEATPGHIRGYDVRTGELKWTFHTIPQEGEFGNETWENDSWKYTGNGGVWSMMSVDPELGYVYLPVEAPSHDFYGGQRLGDNLFSQSLVCLDGETGERVWHFQMVHHGLWDYDPPAAPILHDIEMDGRTIKAVTQLTKQGMSFVFDRATGEPVWPIEERPVPASTVPGERASPTQPFPTKPDYYVPHGYSEDSLIDFTPELRAEALDIAADYVTGPIYTPPARNYADGKLGVWVQPGYGGGSNWNGGAFDPETGLMFVPVRSTAMIASLGEADPDLTNWDYIRSPTIGAPGPRGLPIVKPPWSYVTATDMSSGNHVWSRSIGGAPDYVRNHPDLQDLDLDFDSMGQIGVRPPVLATKTLLFIAESGNLSGDPGGPMFRAYDKLTGHVVAEIELPERASGGPMTYLHEGRQYIVIAVATAEHPAEFVALALPNGVVGGVPSLETVDTVEAAQTPNEPEEAAQTATASAALAETDSPASDAQLSAGRVVYEQSCRVCHGPGGDGTPGGPPALTGSSSIEEVRRVVAGGGVEMPPMSTMLTETQIEDVSQFVVAGLPD